MVTNQFLESDQSKSVKVIGYKVGASNEKAINNLQIGQPFRGPLFSSFVKTCTSSADWPVISWDKMGAALVAAEVYKSSKKRKNCIFRF